MSSLKNRGALFRGIYSVIKITQPNIPNKWEQQINVSKELIFVYDYFERKKQTIIDLLVWLFRTKYKINDCSNNITKHIPYLPYVFGQTGLSKQYRPR